MDAVEQFDYDGLTVKLFYDETPSSPADWDTVGTLVTWHRNFNLGHEQEHYLAQDHDGRVVARYVTLREGALASIPVEILDGPYTLIRETSPEHADGVIYTTRARCEELGVSPEDAEEALRGELKEWAEYAAGDVYGYVIEDAEGKTLDSLWGLYGREYAEEEARRAADWEAKDLASRLLREAAERAYWANKDVPTL